MWNLILIFDLWKNLLWYKRVNELERKSYCKIGEFDKNYKQYKNKSEKTIFRE